MLTDPVNDTKDKIVKGLGFCFHGSVSEISLWTPDYHTLNIKNSDYADTQSRPIIKTDKGQKYAY